MIRTFQLQPHVRSGGRQILSGFAVWLLLVTNTPNCNAQSQAYQVPQTGQSQPGSQLQPSFSGLESDYCAQPENATSPECGGLRQDDRKRLLDQPAQGDYSNAMGNRYSYPTLDPNAEMSLDSNANARQKNYRGNAPEYR